MASGPKLGALNGVWYVGRTRTGFSIRVRHPHGVHRFTQVCFVAGTGWRQERLAHAIAALPDIARELDKYHDLCLRSGASGVAQHKAGEAPEACSGCAALDRISEIQP